MDTIECKFCGLTISATATECERCGGGTPYGVMMEDEQTELESADAYLAIDAKHGYEYKMVHST